MNKIKNYDIPFAGLKLGIHTFNYNINKSFFDLFNIEQEFKDCFVDVIIKLDKGSTIMELIVDIKGKIFIPCDLTNEMFWLDIQHDSKMLVKFSDHYDDTSDDLLILPLGEHSLNVAQIIYEGILISIPLKKVNLEVQNSEQFKKIKNLLDDLSPKEDFKNSDQIDPRWEKLKNLK